MSSQNFLESLEPRIAPAVVINAGPANQGGIGYTDSPFVDTDASADPGVVALFNQPGSDHNYYYLTLKSGDTLNLFNSTPGAGYDQFVKVTGGEVLVFFHDINNDGLVGADELTGLSLGAKAKVQVNGSVDGDIVANYDAASKTINTTSLISETQTIAGLSVSGSVNGRVIAGGSITGINIAGNVEQIATGTAAVISSSNPAVFYTYDFGGSTPDVAPGVGEATLTAFTPGAKKAGGSISNVSVGTLNDTAAPSGYGSIVASDGGAGGVGGSISNVNVVADTTGFNILAGSGGDAGSGATAGGAGGKITNVRVFGVVDSTINDLVSILGGDGGAGTGTGKGGAGGTVSSVYFGYDQAVGKTAPISANLLQDNVLIAGGNGGTGKAAGSGGSITNVFVATSTPDGAGHELTVAGGDGGSDLDAAGGKGGVGGSLTNVEIRNFNDLALAATISATAGDGGNGGTQGTGGIGGSVKTVTFLGFGIEVQGGNGADGAVKGGNGGALTDIALEHVGDVIPQQLLAVSGNGGNAGKGLGGVGGNIVSLEAGRMDVSSGNLVVTAGNGGNSTSSTGGKGGLIQTLNVVDNNSLLGNAGSATITSGNGGSGGKKGGIGGDILSVAITGDGFGASLTAGSGGNATTLGAGGNGGSVKNSGVAVTDAAVDYDAQIVAGAGGSAAGKGKAGNGGSILASNLNADGSVTLTAGLGGAGASGTAGAGGSITQVAGASGTGNASATAGDAGSAAGSVKGANGGSLTNVSLSAMFDINIIAGDGTGGGSGGNLQTIAFTGAGSDITGPLRGNVTILGGDGSVSGSGVAGKGGFLKNLNGYASVYDLSGTAVTTLIKAGNGADGSKKGGDGGYISDLTILGGDFVSNDGVNSYGYGLTTIWAGDAGASTGTGAGGKGGSVSNLSVALGTAFDYSDPVNPTVSSVSIPVANLIAGDGGDATNGKGGLGGSITNIYSLGDIGFRSGKAFGFDSSTPANYYNRMGGIFAGLGGEGSKGDGAAGNVISVTASAISSIVAGKSMTTPGFVTKVDAIFLNGDGDDAPVTDTDGSYLNWDSAVFVGAIAGEPTDPDANIFKTTDGDWTPTSTWVQGTTQPLDGLIAALTLTTKRNFSPQAFLTLDSNGNAELVGERVP